MAHSGAMAHKAANEGTSKGPTGEGYTPPAHELGEAYGEKPELEKLSDAQTCSDLPIPDVVEKGRSLS